MFIHRWSLDRDDVGVMRQGVARARLRVRPLIVTVFGLFALCAGSGLVLPDQLAVDHTGNVMTYS
jgi:hypothetical protein